MITKQNILDDYAEFRKIVAEYIKRQHLEITWDKFYRQTDLHALVKHTKIIKMLSEKEEKEQC